MNIDEMIGNQYGRLTILGLDHIKSDPHGKRDYVKCQCSCGAMAVVDYDKIKSGHTRSCGCLARRPGNNAPIERHGKSKTPLYSVWNAMLDRCMNRKMKFYDRYGGRGISVCDEWMSYTTFEKWAFENGYERGLEIDRIDNDGDYTPDNCRWVTHAINLQNTHRRRTLIVNGQEISLAQLAKDMGERYNDVYNLVDRGRNGDEIVAIIQRRQRQRAAKKSAL